MKEKKKRNARCFFSVFKKDGIEENTEDGYYFKGEDVTPLWSN